MKRISVLLTCLFVTLAAISPATAAKMTQQEKQALLDHLEKTRNLFLKSVEGLSEEQWNFRAAKDRWTIAECAEHIAVTEEFLQENITQLVDGEPATPEQLAISNKDATVLQFITNRAQKFEAPKQVQPNKRWKDPAQSLRVFGEERDKTISLVKAGGDLRQFASAHPVFEQLDAYGWFLFLSGHSERHTLQILEVKEAEGYPASQPSS